MKNLHQTYAIHAPIAKVWKALTDPQEIEHWEGGPNVMMNDQVGTKFTLWDGSIYGTNLEVQPQKLLKQEWSAGEWPNPSIVTFSITKLNDTTIIDLVHTNIPDEDVKDIELGWKEYYLGAIKEYLES